MAVKPQQISAGTVRDLASFLGQFYDDPVGFVMAAFPWGQATLPDGTYNPLHDKKGPEEWQVRLLKALGEHIRENSIRTAIGLQMEVWRSARASGHGVGKSALVAWLILFFMTTRIDMRGVVTASTQFQLEDKTWPELAKWHQLAINKDWFTWSATQFYFAAYPEDKRKNYMFTAATVSETKTEAFAGLHNEGRAVVVIFDEGSGILSKVWEVATGATTDGEAFFLAFGNPTRPDGDFADCFDKNKVMYNLEHVDSRSVSFTNKNALRDIIQMYGPDSDEAKIRVYGQFPTQSYNGFIPINVVSEAAAREMYYDPGEALIMSIDVARFGNDRTVLGFRQGRDFRSRKWTTLQGANTMHTAEVAMRLIGIHKPDVIVIESTGPGAGVIDRLRQMGYRVLEVHPGGAAVEYTKYVNKRAELWATMRDWLYERGCIPEDPELSRELTTIQYKLDRHEQRIQMEAKQDMKERGLPSPDIADMLALSFAARPARRDALLNQGRLAVAGGEDYDPLA